MRLGFGFDLIPCIRPSLAEPSVVTRSFGTAGAAKWT